MDMRLTFCYGCGVILKMKYSFILTLHALYRWFYEGKKSLDPLHVDYVPSVFTVTPKKIESQIKALERYCRKRRREETFGVNLCKEPDIEDTTNDTVEVGCQTLVSQSDLTSMQRNLNTRAKEISELKAKILRILLKSINDFSEEQALLYTGLPLCVLIPCFNKLCLVLPEFQNQKLNPWQQFLIFMMKIRLNLTFSDLGFRFEIHRVTAERIFDKWLNAAYARFSCLIRWPTPQELNHAMPTCFIDKFSRCACIIDCTEIVVCRSSDLFDQGATYSTYKAKNTAKLLIAITPQGSVCYVSCSWGGRASDNYITEQEEIISKVEPGQLILADRGFTLGGCHGIGMHAMEVPALKGKREMRPVDLGKSRDFARVRIHTERVIGQLKQKFTILKGPINIYQMKRHQAEDDHTTATFLDKIVKVCCAFHNLRESSVVPGY